MDCNSDERKVKRRGVSLTKKRKLAIQKFKELDESWPGSEEWCYRLYEFMRGADSRLKFSDIQRLVDKHPWIFDSNTNPEASEVSSANMNPHEWRTGLSSGVQNPKSQGYFASHESIDVSMTPSSTITSASSYSPGTNNHNIQARNIGQANPRGSVQDQECLKKELFQNAFNSVSVLHDICKQMPEARICLRPLKEIHRVFVRNHEKFVFPEEYVTVRHSCGPEDITPRIKVDQACSMADDIVELSEPETSLMGY